MKTCDYCGKENEDAAPACMGCGLDFEVPRIKPAIPPELPGILNAKVASRLILAFLLTFICLGMVLLLTTEVLAGILERGREMSHAQLRTIDHDLTATISLLSYLTGGVIMIWQAYKLVPQSIKDGSPRGAAWTIGPWKGLTQGFLAGAVMSLGIFVLLNLIGLHSHKYISELTRASVLPNWPEIVLITTSIFFAPPIEEALFRGVAYGGFRKTYGPITAAGLTTVIFLILHIPQYIFAPASLIGIAMLALVTLWFRLRWGAIGPAIAVHVAFNLVPILLLTGQKIWYRH